jgi:hypothetical protein
MTTSVRGRARRLRMWVRRIPVRFRLGVIVAMIALAGLAWEHHSHNDSPPITASFTPTARSTPGVGDYGENAGQQQLPAPTVAPQAASIDAARAVAARFAANFATPGNDREDWLARIDGDVSTQLREQYQLTDVRNVTQAAVSAVEGPLDQLPGAVEFRAAYSDGSQVQMHLELEVDGWKIVNVVPVVDLGVR